MGDESARIVWEGRRVHGSQQRRAVASRGVLRGAAHRGEIAGKVAAPELQVPEASGLMASNIFVSRLRDLRFTASYGLESKKCAGIHRSSASKSRQWLGSPGVQHRALGFPG